MGLENVRFQKLLKHVKEREECVTLLHTCTSLKVFFIFYKQFHEL